jgi:uncharacterized BrkB/YihY/UPF0761 family membrane protein
MMKYKINEHVWNQVWNQVFWRVWDQGCSQISGQICLMVRFQLKRKIKDER